MSTEKSREFYKFSGTYHIAPDTSAEDMAADAACLLDSAEAIIGAVIDDFGPNISLQDQAMIFGVQHFVAMAHNLCNEVKADLEDSRHAASRQAEANA
jgi:hypothetical protein